MKYRCIVKGENIPLETNGTIVMSGFITSVIIESDSPSEIEMLAMNEVQQSPGMKGVKFASGGPSMTLLGMSKSVAIGKPVMEFQWFPMDGT